MEIEPNEVFADELDRAAHISEMANQTAVQEIRLAAQPEQVPVRGRYPHTECTVCGDDIPEGRLKLGKIRCIFCQEKVERVRRGLG